MSTSRLRLGATLPSGLVISVELKSGSEIVANGTTSVPGSRMTPLVASGEKVDGLGHEEERGDAHQGCSNGREGRQRTHGGTEDYLPEGIALAAHREYRGADL